MSSEAVALVKDDSSLSLKLLLVPLTLVGKKKGFGGKSFVLNTLNERHLSGDGPHKTTKLGVIMF